MSEQQNQDSILSYRYFTKLLKCVRTFVDYLCILCRTLFSLLWDFFESDGSFSLSDPFYFKLVPPGARLCRLHSVSSFGLVAKHLASSALIPCTVTFVLLKPETQTFSVVFALQGTFIIVFL